MQIFNMQSMQASSGCGAGLWLECACRIKIFYIEIRICVRTD